MGGSQEEKSTMEKADRAAPEKAGWWANFKASVKGKTRAGRRAAQASELEAERQRQLNMDPTPFRFKPLSLGELVDPKNVPMLRDFGGVKGLLDGLGTDEFYGLDLGGTKADEAGIDADARADLEKGKKSEKGPSFVDASVDDRERVYGNNVLPQRKSKSLLMLMWLALQDKILILLCIAAVVSLALGLYTDFGTEPERVACDNPPPGEETCAAAQVDWVEGVAIIVAIAIVDLVGSVNDYQKERQFKKLNAKKEERDVKVIRRGKPALMSVHDVLVGDILQLEPGEIVPCDGVFLRGHNVKCDESGATGESDMIRKVTYDECIKDLDEARAFGEKPKNRDCFLISGSRVLEGVGEYVVIAVGPSSFNGKLMLSLRSDAEDTPLQAKLNNLAELIAKLGSSAGLLLFGALMIRFFVQLRTDPDRTANEKAQSFIDILIIAVTLVVVAVPEGLPLAVTLALAFATKRMTEMNLLVRLLGACETMANASVVCTDKTGTLTQNEMSVVAGSVGAHLKFAYRLEENRSRINTGEESTDGNGPSTVQTRQGRRDWAIDQHELSTVIDGPLRTLFNDAIAVNSTAFEEEEQTDADNADTTTGAIKKRGLLGWLKGSKKSEAVAKKQVGFVGSKTETALLKMAKELGWEDYRASRDRAEIVQMIPFSSERKAMGVVVKRPEGGYRLFLKGASEVLTKVCNRHVDVPHPDDEDAVIDGSIRVSEFTEETRDNIAKTIIFYANQTLRTIAICYRDFEHWPPPGADMNYEGGEPEVEYNDLANDLTLIAITGIEDPLRPGVKEAVENCKRAGVQVKMCTGDNVLTARSIATQCGIYTAGGIIMEGPVFRKLSDADMLEVVPRLQVLARSSPEDKKRLVEKLKSLGEVVGVTGDGTNDGPALKTANVGFSMGIAGTEVAKEASDIILMDDNFSSIVGAIMWGRCVNDAVRKFLQFQLSVNIGAVLITFITAVASEEEESALKAVQLLWLNLIMDTLAALALATDPATPDLLDRKPDRRNAPLISMDMWKMIVGQSLYQTIVVLVLNFAGKSILRMNATSEADILRQDVELSALVFNTFVWCQIFNQVNARRLDRGLNIFKNIHRNPWFISILLIEIGAQTLIMYVGGAAFSVTELSGRDWAISIVVGLISWPLAILIRLIPTAPIEKFCIKMRVISDPNALPTVAPEKSAQQLSKEWDEPAIGQVAEKLDAFSKIRGGRIRASSMVLKSRSRRMRDADVHPQSLMAMVPALIGASIVGAWKPTQAEGATLHDPASGDPSVSSQELYKGGKLQFHPDTDESDTFFGRLKNGMQ
ncbi:calcium-translocating P-type ATPase [Violaceomyces palustris]|uniref:Calcium-translocating P-type ATPase n=1 Tax=Violaceomyces palustris TaxID=1673888 RepID=A0ACD0P6B9_9BASI|nr:calcium-translocating P-type ATPase [Violaceomyces palustris]